MPKHCNRNLNDHCCHMVTPEGKGYACPFLEENTQEGYRWTCGLRKELGSWDLVHNDPRYQEHVQPFWDEYAPKINQNSCGTFTCVNCIDG